MPKNAPFTLDDEWFTGKDKVLQFTDTVPSNITGWALKFVLAQNPHRTEVLVTKTTTDGITITDGAAGVCQVTIADTDTDGLPGSDDPDYFYELTRTDAGSEDVLAFGTVVLRQSPTS